MLICISIYSSYHNHLKKETLYNSYHVPEKLPINSSVPQTNSQNNITTTHTYNNNQQKNNTATKQQIIYYKDKNEVEMQRFVEFITEFENQKYAKTCCENKKLTFLYQKRFQNKKKKKTAFKVLYIYYESLTPQQAIWKGREFEGINQKEIINTSCKALTCVSSCLARETDFLRTSSCMRASLSS